MWPAIYKLCIAGWPRATKTSAFWPPPPLQWLPILLIHIGSQVKKDKVIFTKIQNNAKNSNVGILQQTLHATWSCLIRCINMKWIQLVLLKIQSGHDSVHRRTDRRMDGRKNKVRPVYPPFSFVEAGGMIMNLHGYELPSQIRAQEILSQSLQRSLELSTSIPP